MKPGFTCLLVLLLGACATAQSPARDATKRSNRAAVEGIVTKDPGSEPVKKALIELIAENQSEGGNYTAVSGPDGAFRIENIEPGRYRLFTERTGLLEVEKHGPRTDGRVLTLAGGQELKDLQIRLQAAAVVRGRVTDEDGDPMSNAQVAVLRQTFASGHSHWEQTGAERTNDLGEYRIANLPAGTYYVSVSPPPDFKSLIEGASKAPAAEKREGGTPDNARATSYQTAYYPGTVDRGQAAPIQLHTGDDFPANFSLTPSPSLTIRGSVANLPPRSSATIMLQSNDFNLVLNGAEIHKDGSFVIRDVAPGAYTILASVENAFPPMMARQALQVGPSSVEGLRLVPQAGGSVRGRLRVESKGNPGRFDLVQSLLALQSADGEDTAGTVTVGEGFSNLAHVGVDGSFEWKGVPPGVYRVLLAGDDGGRSADWFLKSAVAAGHDVDESGISVNGDTVALELVASASGGVADGVVTDHKGQPAANVVVVAVPDPRLRTRPDRFRTAATDQGGRFILHGIPPGDYTLFAWESVDGEAYYDPEFLKAYEGQGIPLHVSEGERKSMQVEVIPEGEDQP